MFFIWSHLASVDQAVVGMMAMIDCALREKRQSTLEGLFPDKADQKASKASHGLLPLLAVT